MFEQDVNKKSKVSPKSIKGMVLRLMLCMLISLTALAVAGCAEDVGEEAVEQEGLVKELEEEIASLEEALAEQEEKIKVMAKAGWSYELLANNQKVFENGYLYIDEPDLDLVLRETQPPYYDQYVEEFNQGILRNSADHVTLLTQEKLYQETAADGTTVSDVPVAFLLRDLEPGDVIELEVSEELQERMHLEHEVVTIEKR